MPKNMKLKSGSILFAIILFGLFLLCVQPPTATNSNANFNGLWKTIEGENTAPLDNDWIPSNYHIKENDSNIFRVRIIDPIVCTGAYPVLKGAMVEFSQYGFNFQILFKSDTTASVQIQRADSIRTNLLYKSDDEPYWGPCK